MKVSEFSLEQVTAYVFVVDTLNFCFWPKEEEHQVQYEDMTKALAQILREEPEFFTSERLSLLTEQELRAKVFKDLEIFPLMDERARLVREVGHVVTKRF